MSVQAKEKHIEATKKTKNVEALTTPKKRKHDADGRESTKKKKRPRTDETANSPPITSREPVGSKEKEKKKKKKSRPVQEEATVQSVEQAQDVELPDATTPEHEADEETFAQSLVDTADDVGEVELEDEDVPRLLESEDPTSFYSTRLSLCVSIPAISLESSTSSLLATHLAPLLLTYFPPAQGIVLAFSDPVLSAKPNSGINLPLSPPQADDVETRAQVFAGTADEFGVCWVWLTATFLTFRPQRGDKLHGWTNVASEGFVGLVSYNYFQTAVGKTRIPSDWNWSGPSREQQNRKRGRKGRLRDATSADDSQEHDTQETEVTLVEATSSQVPLNDDGGHFADADGTKIKSTLDFRVVDTEVVPAHDRGKWSLQIGGTLLDEDAERDVVEEERAKFERAQDRGRSKSPGGSEVVMSGGLGRSSREGSVASRISGQTPTRHRKAY